MKILWVNNIAIPQIAGAVGMEEIPMCGWLVKLAEEIAAVENLDLTIAFPHEKNTDGTVGNIRYSGFSIRNEKIRPGNLGGQGDRLREIIETTAPDVVHIFGTEYAHTYAVTEVCRELGLGGRVIIAIQGLVSVCARHYEAYLKPSVVNGRTLRDFYKGNVADNRKSFEKAGALEIAALRNVRHVLGRTDWDRACMEWINPKAVYHFNNEMLRDSFYRGYRWEAEKCRKHSLFLSQATMPLKGLHLALEAVVLLRPLYPDLTVNIAGKSFSAKSKWKRSYYEKSILSYIEKNHLENVVRFTGFLKEEEMCRQYLQTHVFVAASSIENSPNSVCEAMALGVPVVTSMVGGVANLLEHGKEGFYYQADAPYMLAYYIRQIFENDCLAEQFSENERKRAMKRHDRKAVVGQLLEAYGEVSKECIG